MGKFEEMGVEWLVKGKKIEEGALDSDKEYLLRNKRHQMTAEEKQILFSDFWSYMESTLLITDLEKFFRYWGLEQHNKFHQGFSGTIALHCNIDREFYFVEADEDRVREKLQSNDKLFWEALNAWDEKIAFKFKFNKSNPDDFDKLWMMLYKLTEYYSRDDIVDESFYEKMFNIQAEEALEVYVQEYPLNQVNS